MSEGERLIPNPTGEDGDAAPPRRWRTEFPYHWDIDDLVSRRELLRLAVYASGALFSCTALLAILGLRRRAAARRTQAIARASEVPEGSALYFHYPSADDGAVLLHLVGGRFVAYSQKCTHLSCAVYYQQDRGRLFCPCHDGVFDPRTGEPIAGPPQRRLPQIRVQQQGDILYALEEQA